MEVIDHGIFVGVGSDEAQEGDIRRFFATVLSSLHTHTSRWSRQDRPPHMRPGRSDRSRTRR